MLRWLRSAPIACALLLQLLVLFPFSGLLSCGTRSGYSIFITLLIDNARGLDSWAVFSVVLVFPYPQGPKSTGPRLTVSSIILGSVSDEVMPTWNSTIFACVMGGWCVGGAPHPSWLYTPTSVCVHMRCCMGWGFTVDVCTCAWRIESLVIGVMFPCEKLVVMWVYQRLW